MNTDKDKYKFKQDWMEAVMASDLSLATKVYAWGIFKHMFGVKTDAWPGAKGLSEATGLNDSQFYKYNTALKDCGFFEVTSRKGRSNEYVLILPTSTEGRYLPPQRVTLPSERVTPTSTEGTNTTSNTSSKTTSENNKESLHVADAPVGKSRYSYIRTDTQASSNLDSVPPIYFIDLEGVTGPLNCDSSNGTLDRQIEVDNTMDNEELYPRTEDGTIMDGLYWHQQRKIRPLTKDEKELSARQSRAYQTQKHVEAAVSVFADGEEW